MQDTCAGKSGYQRICRNFGSMVELYFPSLITPLSLQAAFGCLRTVRVTPRAFILFSMIVEILARGSRIIR